MDAASSADGANFTPITHHRRAAGDRVDVVAATQVASGANVLLAAASTGDSAQLRSLLPVSSGMSVLLAPDVPGDPCVVRSVTAVAASTADAPQQLTSPTPAPHNQAGFTTPVTYADRGRVTLLGALRWSRYRLEGTDLRLERPLGGDAGRAGAQRRRLPRPVRAGGDDAAGSTALESWQGRQRQLSPRWRRPTCRACARCASGWSRAARSARSPTPPASAAPAPNCRRCSARRSPPTSADWACYRWRVAIAAVPLRNLVMGMTP